VKNKEKNVFKPLRFVDPEPIQTSKKQRKETKKKDLNFFNLLPGMNFLQNFCFALSDCFSNQPL
jgi:hypothetical protein